MVNLELTERQAEYLKDIVDNWLEGYAEATVDVERDPTFEEPEEMLDALDGITSQFRDAVEIRQQLWEALAPAGSR